MNICPIKPEIINKGWGFEKILFNSKELNLCSKILHYYKNGSTSSFHLHLEKSEIFVCQKGFFILNYKFENGVTTSRNFNEGDCIFIPKGAPHQLICKQDNSEILEISTFHNDLDVVRIGPGDSQK